MQVAVSDVSLHGLQALALRKATEVPRAKRVKEGLSTPPRLDDGLIQTPIIGSVFAITLGKVTNPGLAELPTGLVDANDRRARGKQF